MKVVGQGLNRVDGRKSNYKGSHKQIGSQGISSSWKGDPFYYCKWSCKSFDLTEALKVPGVVKILTCFDAPDCYCLQVIQRSVEAAHQDIIW